MKNKVYQNLWLMGIIVLISSQVFAAKGPDGGNRPNGNQALELRADCKPGVTETDMDINNVRSRLSTGGDVWWNRQEGLYIVPKPAEGQRAVSSIFAGGVWVGGTTRAGSLKLAGVTYRSLTSNYDWFPGPLDEEGGTESEICADWDRFFTVDATDIAAHNSDWEELGSEYSCDSIPDGVKYWPGQGNPFWREKYDFDLPKQPLGAFYDENKDGIYNPCDGDFPTIQIEGCPRNADAISDAILRAKNKELVPDQMIFWIYNDNGGPHRLSSGDPIRMEVQVQAFAYATNDEINDMTFLRYRLLNKASEDLIDCYFAKWVDPDLGCAFDDYSGVDNTIDASGKPRSLAYTYNEDAVDGNNGANCSGGVNTYGFEVPNVGTDYFRGPLGPKVFARDPNTNEVLRDTVTGEPILEDPVAGTGVSDTLVELGMTSCIFTFNCASNPPNDAQCDPQGSDEQFYRNMRGLWRNGDPVTEGGTGYGGTDTTKFMFTDLPNNPNGWSMCTAGISNVDTRTLQATGPLLLQPGRKNELIVGVVWVPDVEHPCPDLVKLRGADDLAQALFDNCFDITDGPDAPDISGVELDKELILMLSNSESSNNFKEGYAEVDLQYSGPDGGDNTYNFEGYRVYQLRDAGVSVQDLDDPTKARQIVQVDVKNNIAEIFNWTPTPNPFNPDDRVWVYSREVSGGDAGIQRSFQIVEDQFAPTDRRLINHKPYHYMVLAYAHNNWKDFDIKDALGQRRSYLDGRRNVRAYSFTPRPIVYENLNSVFGQGATITRVKGAGNQGGALEIDEATRVAMLNPGFDGRITYAEGSGPFEIKVVNPLEVVDGKYRLEVVGEFDPTPTKCGLKPGAKWQVTDLTTNQVIAAERSIEEVNEQLIYKRGFSINMSQPELPGMQANNNNGAISISLDYKDDTKPWFLPVTNTPNPVILSAFNVLGASTVFIQPLEDETPEDPTGIYKNLNGGAFFPLYSARVQTTNSANQNVPPYLSPGPREGNLLRLARSTGDISLSQLNNVDIVFTDNKELWSKCIVVESANQYHYDDFGLDTETGTEQMDLIKKPSLGKDGKPDGSTTQGFSWFPGYAVDVETGQRVNIFFSENTIYAKNPQFMTNPAIAHDMIFNPGSQIISSNADGSIPGFGNLVMGGQHMIYVTRENYDGCEDLAKEFAKSTIPFNRLAALTWTSFVMNNASVPMKSVEDGLIPTELTVKLRVTNTFNQNVFYDDLNALKRCKFEDGLPQYEFEFKGKEATELAAEEYVGALANVNVVPNPYYAYSAYENSELVNTIKVTNLPDRAIVTIYTLDGKFIRQFNRDERSSPSPDQFLPNVGNQTKPAIEWDLKNSKGIPIASGVYLIHISAPTLGEERVIKWFGINRKFDPTGL